MTWWVKFVGLAFTAMIAFLVWRHYRRATCGEWEKYSTFAPRFWAPAVDGLVLWPVNFASSALLGVALPKAVAVAVLLVQNTAWLVYTVVMHVRYGQTVGKKVTKVRVADFKTEGKISWLQGWLREGIPAVVTMILLGYQIVLFSGGTLSAEAAAHDRPPVDVHQAFTIMILSFVPGLWFLAEVMTMFSNQKRRALHDLIAGTVVIRTNAKEAVGLPRTNPPGGRVNARPVATS